MKALILLTLFSSAIIWGTASRGDIITCISDGLDMQYSMSQQVLTISNADTKLKTVIENVSFQVKGPGVFDLAAPGDGLLMTLTLNNQGSDGASDRVFPYSVKWASLAAKHYNIGAEDLYGGCESNYLKVTGQK